MKIKQLHKVKVSLMKGLKPSKTKGSKLEISKFLFIYLFVIVIKSAIFLGIKTLEMLQDIASGTLLQGPLNTEWKIFYSFWLQILPFQQSVVLRL